MAQICTFVSVSCRVHKNLRAERYCGQLQSYQYQPLVQYTKVDAG
jgi:hypothetical protein